MKFGLRRLPGLAKRLLRGQPRSRSAKRLFHPTLVVEGLERREVMSTVVPAPLASLTGYITAQKQTSLVYFKLNPGQYVSNRAIPVLLTLQTQGLPGTNVVPRIVRLYHVNGAMGHQIPTKHQVLFAKVSDPLSNTGVYAARIREQFPATGGYSVKISLTGDANGDGQVNRVDLGIVRASMGSVVGQTRYNPAADFNHDGRVGKIDLYLVHRNFGSTASIISISPMARPNPFQSAGRSTEESRS